MHCAAFHGHTKIIKLLADAGGNVELNDEWYGGTPLAWAAFGDQVKAARMLVKDLGAERETKNSQGQVPFNLVSTPTNPEWVGVLIDVRFI
jgi:ankyrin repeat protein